MVLTMKPTTFEIKKVSVDKNGTFHVTRNACAGVIVGASMDVVNDVKLNREGFDWALIEEKPFLHPGHLVNIVAAPL